MYCNKYNDKDFVPSFLQSNDNKSSQFYSQNGLVLFDTYFPEEIMTHILSFIDPRQLLKYTLVCREWKKIIRSNSLWALIYERRYKRKARDLSWYLHYCLFTTNYFTNLLYAESSNELLEHSKYIINEISDCPDMDNYYGIQHLSHRHSILGSTCVLMLKTRLKPQMRRRYCIEPDRCYREHWMIKLRRSKLFQYILDAYKPHLYFKDCGSIKGIQCGFLNDDTVKDEFLIHNILRKNLPPQHVYSMELTITDYPNNIIQGILIETEYTEIAAGGSLDGSQVRFIFDSIQPSVSCNTTSEPGMAINYKNCTEGEVISWSFNKLLLENVFTNFCCDCCKHP